MNNKNRQKVSNIYMDPNRLKSQMANAKPTVWAPPSPTPPPSGPLTTRALQVLFQSCDQVHLVGV